MARCRSAAFALFIVAALLTGTARLDRQRRRVPMVTGTQVIYPQPTMLNRTVAVTVSGQKLLAAA